MNVSSRIVARACNRRLLALAAIVIVALSTAGCFDREADQRRAFIAFLQTRIIDKPGLHIPILSEKEKTDIGSYADQYYIMSGFHHGLNDALNKDLARAIQLGSPRSIEDLVNHRDILPVVRDGMVRMKTALEKVEADADAAHKALQQPPDLKAVYDIAYERMVTRPASVFRELLPIIQSSLPATEELAAFLDEHRNTIEYRGGQPVSKDPAVGQKLAVLMQAAAKSAAASNEGKRKLRAMAESR
ncbi:MAG: DUF3053 family protein [Pseudolabrys sp.]